MIKKINKNVQSQLMFVVFTLTTLLSYHKCVSAINANLFDNRVIHEESYQPPALQISPAAAIAFSRHQKDLGKNNLLNSNLNSNDAVKSESVESIMNKRYSHKEEIFGDDSTSVDDEKLKETLRPESEFKSQQSSFNENKNTLKAVQSKDATDDKKVVKSSSNADSTANSGPSSNEVVKKRAQRIEKYSDLKHHPIQQQQQQQHNRDQTKTYRNSISKNSYFDYNHEDIDQQLRDYRQNKMLEKEILTELDDLYNYDYEVMMMKLLLGKDDEPSQDEELDETQMDTNELGNVISHESWPNNYDENKMDLKNLNSLFKQDLSDNELIELLNADLQQQQQQQMGKIDEEEEPMRLVNKPVKIQNVKESLYSESNYNNRLKSESNPKEQNQNAYIDEIFKNFDLNLLPTTKEQILHSQPVQLEQESQVKSNSNNNNNKNQINSVNGSPSLAVKSRPGAVDPNLNDKIDQIKQQNDYLFIFVVAGCVVASAVALVAAGVCWYTVHRGPSNLQSDFPTKPNSMFGSAKNSSFKSNTSSGDRRLAQSAQMYHYQHQKQQMIAMEKANNDIKPDNSDNSEGETEEGDYTVYECPGLAPTGEMEVKNPLFKEDYSASTHSIFTNTSMPPPYSAIDSANENKQSLEQPIEQKVATTDSVTIPIRENSEQQ